MHWTRQRSKGSRLQRKEKHICAHVLTSESQIPCTCPWANQGLHIWPVVRAFWEPGERSQPFSPSPTTGWDQNLMFVLTNFEAFCSIISYLWLNLLVLFVCCVFQLGPFQVCFESKSIFLSWVFFPVHPVWPVGRIKPDLQSSSGLTKQFWEHWLGAAAAPVPNTSLVRTPA